MNLINDDCMNIMPKYEDDYFDLAIVDPPYRNADNNDANQWVRKTIKKGRLKDWNDKPNKKYFDELFRVSKNQIIWGANNFTLPEHKGFIVWKKLSISEQFNMSMCEYAYISEKLGSISKLFECLPQDKNRIHPTQKPVRLYRWILENYAEPSDKVLDTHLGSGSSAIACHYFGTKNFVGIEIDKEYFDNAKTRIEKETRQIKLL